MKIYLTTCVLLLAVGGVLGAPPAPEPDKSQKSNPTRFVLEAVAHGLIEDGVAPALAAELAKRDDFVIKCDLCGPTQRALRDHGNMKDAPAAKGGKGLPEELVKRLKSDTATIRRFALRELVQRYIEREYARSDMTPEQKAAMQKEAEAHRKLAMGGLKEGQKFCPACDGACRLTPKL